MLILASYIINKPFPKIIMKLVALNVGMKFIGIPHMTSQVVNLKLVSRNAVTCIGKALKRTYVLKQKWVISDNHYYRQNKTKQNGR